MEATGNFNWSTYFGIKKRPREVKGKRQAEGCPPKRQISQLDLMVTAACGGAALQLICSRTGETVENISTGSEILLLKKSHEHYFHSLNDFIYEGGNNNNEIAIKRRGREVVEKRSKIESGSNL